MLSSEGSMFQNTEDFLPSSVPGLIKEQTANRGSATYSETRKGGQRPWIRRPEVQTWLSHRHPVGFWASVSSSTTRHSLSSNPVALRNVGMDLKMVKD